VPEATVEGLVEELRLLREFYDAWLFLHRTARAPSTGSEVWDKIRNEKAAQALVDASHAVAAFGKPAKLHA
jgi:hypothetical protein